MPRLSASRSPRRGSTLLRVALGLTALALTVYLVHRLVDRVGWEEVARRLGEADPRWVLVTLLAVVAHLSFWAWRQRRAALRLAPSPGGVTVFASLVASASVNLLVPFARLLAALLRARYLAAFSGTRLGKRVFFGTVMYDQLAHFVVMASSTVFGLILGSGLLYGPRAALGAVSGVVLVLSAAFVLARRRVGWSTGEGLVRWFAARAQVREDRGGLAAGAVAGGRTAVRTVLELAAERRLRHESLWLGVGVFGTLVFSQWSAFRALGFDAPPLVVLTAVALGLTAGVMVGTPGGLGATEAAMIGFYVALGVDHLDQATAAGAVLLFRGLHYLVILGLGLPALVWLEARLALTSEVPP